MLVLAFFTFPKFKVALRWPQAKMIQDNKLGEVTGPSYNSECLRFLRKAPSPE